MAFRRSHGIPKKPWRSEEAMAFRRKPWRSEGSHGIQETRTRLLFLSAPFEKTPRRADYGTGGGCAAGGKAAQRPPRETCPAQGMPADQAPSVRSRLSPRKPCSPPHIFRRLVNRPRHIRRPKRFRPQGMFAAQGIIPARGGGRQKPPSVLRRSQPPSPTQRD